jgi:hypothetical protein
MINSSSRSTAVTGASKPDAAASPMKQPRSRPVGAFLAIRLPHPCHPRHDRGRGRARQKDLDLPPILSLLGPLSPGLSQPPPEPMGAWKTASTGCSTSSSTTISCD